MKKIILTIAIGLFSFVFVQGQTGKGDMFLGGNFNLGFGSEKTKVGSTSTDGPKTFNFGISPMFGYFLADNFALGLKAGYNMQTVKEKDVSQFVDEEKVTTTEAHFAPFARYYIMPWEKVGFFMQGELNVAFGKVKDEVKFNGTTNSSDIKMFVFGVDITPNLVYWATKRVALEANFGGLAFSAETDKHGSGDNEVKTSSSNFNLEVNPSHFTFGVIIGL